MKKKIKFKDMRVMLTPEIEDNKVKMVMDIIGSKEQTIKFVNADDLRNIADYIDSHNKK